MRWLTKIVIVLFLFVGIPFWHGIGGTYADERPLIMAVSPWAPYKGEDLPSGGLATEIVQSALKRAGYDTAIIYAPWKRIERGLRSGKYDLVPGAWFSSARTEHNHYGDALAMNRVVLICRKNNPIEFKTMKDLTGLDIAVSRGYAYPEVFQKANNFTRHESVSLEQSLKMVLNERVDCTLGDELVARYTAKKLFATAANLIVYSKVAIEEKKLLFMISKRHPESKKIVRSFNNALKAMKRDGTYDAIYKKFGLELPQS